MTTSIEIAEQMERELLPSTDHDKPDGALYHYTNAEAFLKILETGEIWATHHRYLNDREELRIGEKLVQEEAESLRDRWGEGTVGKAILTDFARIHENASVTKVSHPFIASFSTHGDLLSQWRAYATNGAGYSIGVASFDLPDGDQEYADASLTLVKCEYDHDAFRMLVRTTLERVVNAIEAYVKKFAKNRDDLKPLYKKGVLCLLLHAVSVSVRLKHAAFREEEEWRFIVVPYPERSSKIVRYRATVRGIVPYIPVRLAPAGQKIDLARIYVGPVQDSEVGRVAVQMLLEQNGHDDVVSVSKVPYRG